MGSSVVGIHGSVARKIALFQVQGLTDDSSNGKNVPLRLHRKDGIKRRKSSGSLTRQMTTTESMDVDFSDSSSSACAASIVSTDSCYGGSCIDETQSWRGLDTAVSKATATLPRSWTRSSDDLNPRSTETRTNNSNRSCNSRRSKDSYYQTFTLPRRPGKPVFQLVEFLDSQCSSLDLDSDPSEGVYEDLDINCTSNDAKSGPSMSVHTSNHEDEERVPSPPPYESIYAEPIYGDTGSSGGSSSYWSPASSVYSAAPTSHAPNVLLNNTSVTPPAVPSFQFREPLTSDLIAGQLPPLPSPSSQNKFSSIAKSAGRKLAKKLDYIRRLSRTNSIDGSSFSLSLTPSPLPPSCPSPLRTTNHTTSLYNLSQSSSSSLNQGSTSPRTEEEPVKVKRPVLRPRIPPPAPPQIKRTETLDRKTSQNGGKSSTEARKVPNRRRFDEFLEDSRPNGDADEFVDSDFCDSDSELIRNFVSTVQPIYSMDEEPLYQYYSYGISLQPEDDYQPVIPKNLGLTLEMLIPRQGQRTLWCQIPEVTNSGILSILSDKQKQLQESIFEILTSEVSYLKSLDVLISLFYQNQDLDQLLSETDRAALFGNIKQVREASNSFLKELLKKWEESWYIHDVGNLINQNSKRRFSVYVDYCRNKPYQDSTIQRLRNSCDEFLNMIKSIEEDRKCENLRMDSFLMLPMQRITRLPLLVNAIIQRTQNPKEKAECEQALQSLTNLVIECNEAARESQDLEETSRIMEKLEFHRGHRPLQNPGQFVLKGDFMKNPFETSRGTAKINWTFQKGKRTYYCIILFKKQLFITKKRSSGKLEVVDTACPKDVHIKLLPTLEGISKEYQHYFMLHFEGRDTVYFLAGKTQSELDRWRSKLEQIQSVKELRMRAIFPYQAERSDELSFSVGQIIQVQENQPDGWYFGSTETGEEGWFPGNYVTAET